MAVQRKESNTRTIDNFREEQQRKASAKSQQRRVNQALQPKRPIPGSRMLRAGYVSENGLDKNDANLLRKNPQEFDRKVQGNLIRNMMRYGAGKDYAIERAAERTKKRQEFKDERNREAEYRRSLKKAFEK